MPDKKTILRSHPKLKVRILRGPDEGKELVFAEDFCIGRDASCGLRIQDPEISRIHAEVYQSEGRWWIRDMGSANGTYVEGGKIDRFPVIKPLRMTLGEDGPEISLTLDHGPGEVATEVKIRPGAARRDLPGGAAAPSVTEYAEQYFGGVTREDAGIRTQNIRRAFKRVQKKQTKKYHLIIGAAAVVIVFSGVFAILQHKKIEKQRQLTVDLFYRMKTQEIQLAQLKDALSQTRDAENLRVVGDLEKQLTGMKSDYGKSIDSLGVYGRRLGADDRLILHIANVFGECEVNPPPGFVGEVKKHIKRWQSTGTLAAAVRRAKAAGYDRLIAREMTEKGLPPQFFYLAFQESAFDPNACGPETSFGYAKGMWQFIPPTAKEYGLRLGPNVASRAKDPEDERNNPEKATAAAAAYIRDLYKTDAQASGLLIIASYNWGATGVLRLIRTMPENPRERNFWALMEKHIDRIPEETYNYVFSIFSAAVIGENPALFGFDFENPLADVH
jgi:hypothetical protein